jgi:hypothetical protein
MMMIAAVWISILLLTGGFALDSALKSFVTHSFDEQLGNTLTAMVGSTEIGPDGEIFFNRPLGDQRFMEPNSGLYWQITGKGHEDYPSRSLWDRSLKVTSDHFDNTPHIYDLTQFEGEPLRVMERSIILPGSNTVWRFTVAQRRSELDGQIHRIRTILIESFAVLGLGLLLMAAVQSLYGLRRCAACVWRCRRCARRAPAGWRRRCRWKCSRWWRS